MSRHENVRNVRVFANGMGGRGDSFLLEVGTDNFAYDGGVIFYNTSGISLDKVALAYEPYRLKVRDGLMLIVYGIGVVYLVKNVLNYGVTQGSDLGISVAKHKGGD